MKIELTDEQLESAVRTIGALHTYPKETEMETTTIEQGKETKTEDRCPDCGNTSESGACFFCKMD